MKTLKLKRKDKMKQTMKKQGMVTGVFVLAVAFLLMTAMPVGAAIVYTDLGGLYLKGIPGGNSADVIIDIDNDGLDEFRISHFVNSISTIFEPIFGNIDRDNTSYYVYSHNDGYYDFTEGLSFGQEIGSALTWTNADWVDLEYQEPGWLDGDWQYMADYTGYAGIKFYSTLDDGWHFGWIHMKVDNEDGSAVTVYGYAWETDPETAIIAGAVPEPATMALLGMGGLLLRRRRKSN
jgi:hypothetical protein